ncbi:glucosamine-6-phosphate deaminase [Gaoshiqia sp. Z1-71]|uniref:glucosamine-6-phosphate deaminase n=1 Tax=Gaoshiqia hydrogeniformans TaxID=3290090 RepID=UPI003BF785DB
MDLHKKLHSSNPLFFGTTYYKPKNMSHQDILTKYEKIPTFIYYESEEASILVAGEMAAVIREKEHLGQNCVLGLPTGSSPIGVYAELVRMHREEGLSFKHVVTFNLDEYYPMGQVSVHSYHQYMYNHLFRHIDILPENIHIPQGDRPFGEVYQLCRDYDKAIKDAGGIDVQLLGIGRTGHIGFNEPGSQLSSKTRMIVLDTTTKQDAARDFGGITKVPQRAITMGIDNIMNARKVILLGFGEAKANILQKTIEGPITEQVPASYLQQHGNAKIYIDIAAAMQLTRVKTPWLVDTCDWSSDQLVRKAIVWLCQQTGKSILKLTNNDYINNGLSDLISDKGSAYALNIKVFNDLQHTITGWPGGKPHADDSNRPERKSPAKKRVVVFSPHPDDDVISMGGTLIRLVEQGHEVHVAYQVSGNIAVSDEYANRFISFHNSYTNYYDPGNEHQKEQYEKTTSFLSTKKEGEKDIPDVRILKGLIRRMEAKAACRFAGVNTSNVHFLDLPFYETGEIRKKPLAEEDIRIIKDFLLEIQPHQIFAAGDLSDPHGTHRVCLDAILVALEELKEEAWMKDCWLWLYRGAWHEWDIDQIEMAVPISPEELYKKREAIFRHQSQKEGAMFMGNDAREFWQRAEDRNHATAGLYNKLGMAEYEAMEAFVRYYP